jgi:hypothetical protein
MEAEQSVKRGQTGKRGPPSELAEVLFYIFAIFYVILRFFHTENMFFNILLLFFTCGEEDKTWEKMKSEACL